MSSRLWGTHQFALDAVQELNNNPTAACGNQRKPGKLSCFNRRGETFIFWWQRVKHAVGHRRRKGIVTISSITTYASRCGVVVSEGHRPSSARIVLRYNTRWRRRSVLSRCGSGIFCISSRAKNCVGRKVPRVLPGC